MQRGKLIANGITSLFILACTVGAASWTSSSNNTNKVSPSQETISIDNNKQEFIKSDLTDENDEPVLFFEGNENATEVDASDLMVNITKSTKTPTSQSYTATLSSQITYYTGSTSNQWVYLALDEPTNLTSLDTNSDPDNMPVYTGYVYQITPPTNQTNYDVVIPYRATYGTRAVISVESITLNVINESTAFYQDSVTGDTLCRISSIYIPSTIVDINSSAFSALEGYGITFKLGFEEDDDIYFDLENDFPSDATIEYVGRNEDGLGTGDINMQLGAPRTSPQNYNFIIGSELDYGQGYPENMELGLQYDVYNEDTYLRTVCEYFPTTSATADYDSVGQSVGSTNATMYFDIELGEGEHIDHNSLIFFNIYFASYDGSDYYPDLNYEKYDSSDQYVGTFGQLYSRPGLTFKVDDDIDNYISYSYNSLNTFSGYTTFRMNVQKADVNIYEELMSSIYNTNRSSIDDGTYQIRYRFTSLATGYYRITYLNSDNELVVTSLKIDTPVSYTSINTKRETQMSFLVKNSKISDDFSVKSIRKIELVGMRITLDLYNKSRNSILSKSSMETRFGIITLMDMTDTQPSFTNYNLVLLYVVLGYLVLFSACSIGYYYYSKNKFKNDEFRRVDSKKYTKTAAIAFVMVGIILMAITFICLRAVPLKNAVVTFNPTDVYVFFFSLFAIIAVGYYIRYFYLAYKARKHRKEVIKLRLNEDEDDDGTDVK